MARRLGSHRAVRSSSAFAGVEWALIAAQEVPAPFRPDPNLVYAKDVIAAHSFTGGGKKRSSAGGDPAEAMHDDADGPPPEQLQPELWEYIPDVTPPTAEPSA